jgi:hypothetical protein
VTSIGYYVFSGCNSLTSIIVDDGNGVYSSNDGILYDKKQTVLLYCPGGKSGDFTIPNGVTSIDDDAFSDCASLTSITIPDSMTSIGYDTFYGCSSLTSVIIPNSVTSIDNHGFSHCTSLTNIIVDNGNSVYSSKDGVLYNKKQTVLLYCPAGKSGAFTIPNGVTSIGDDAFSDCERLINVIIPNSVTSIGEDAFWGCENLISITIPTSVTSIGSVAFCWCANLTIYGYTGSYAETYAKECGIPFVILTSEHIWDSGEVTKKATCAEEGTKTYTCTLCGTTKTETIAKDSNNHTGGTEVKDAVSATCGKAGYTGDTYCKGCGTKIQTGTTIPATGKHTWNDGEVTKKATCIATGVKTYTCTVCGTTKTETIAKDSNNHTGGTEVKDAVSATCGKAGYTGDTYCKGCGAKIKTGTTISATGKHTWDSGKVTKKATCIATGVKTYTCTVCGTTKTETIAKDSSNHTGGTEVKDAVSATCGKAGYTGDTYCKGCGAEIKTGTTIPATGKHTWDDGEITKKATCVATGVKTYTCTVCGTTKTETIAKDSSNHTGGTEVKDAVSATCDKAGYTGDTYCKGCGAKIKTGTTISATGKHTWDSGKVTKAATCIATGVKTYTCTVCSTTKTETIEKDSNNHTGGTEVKGAVSATCGKAGYTGDTYCKGCGAKIKTGTTIPATGKHTWDSGKVTKNPSFTATGTKTYTCTVCGETKTETIAKLTKVALNKATVTLSKTSVAYTGKAQKPTVTVKVDGVTVPSSQYTVSYSNNTKVGTAKVTIKATSKATYISGSVTKTFTITKATNPLTVSPTSKSFTVANCKKKAQTFTIKASKAQGTVSYKSSNTKYVTVSKGKVTVKKGTPKGTYKITVTAKGNGTYNSGSKTVTITVK